MSSIFTGKSIQTGSISPAVQSSNNVLGKEEFLKLLVTQLHYQDPLNPLEGTEFSAQLAEFSSLEQLQNMNEALQQSLDANYLLTTSINNTLAANVIGKGIKAYGNHIVLEEGQEATLWVDLSAQAKNVEIEIRNENDQVVRTLTFADVAQGENSFTWDGKNTQGETLPPGVYTFSVKATDNDSKDISVTTYTVGQVSGVRYTASGAILMMNDLEVLMSDVYEIFEY
ncbi:MAG: flagellar hook assembly protein FlgD [Calditrichia bacterium]